MKVRNVSCLASLRGPVGETNDLEYGQPVTDLLPGRGAIDITPGAKGMVPWPPMLAGDRVS